MTPMAPPSLGEASCRESPPSALPAGCRVVACVTSDAACFAAAGWQATSPVGGAVAVGVHPALVLMLGGGTRGAPFALDSPAQLDSLVVIKVGSWFVFPSEGLPDPSPPPMLAVSSSIRSVTADVSTLELFMESVSVPGVAPGAGLMGKAAGDGDPLEPIDVCWGSRRLLSCIFVTSSGLLVGRG